MHLFIAKSNWIDPLFKLSNSKEISRLIPKMFKPMRSACCVWILVKWCLGFVDLQFQVPDFRENDGCRSEIVYSFSFLSIKLADLRKGFFCMWRLDLGEMLGNGNGCESEN